MIIKLALDVGFGFLRVVGLPPTYSGCLGKQEDSVTESSTVSHC